jgi:AcrR family transcriptional regulator
VVRYHGSGRRRAATGREARGAVSQSNDALRAVSRSRSPEVLPAGRRPGNADTRGQILAAAREEFATNGYRGATIRAIAARSQVDPALVHHYFGPKRQLFVETLQLPFDPTQLVSAAADGPRRETGERLARALLAVWASDTGRATMQSMLRSALTDPESLDVYREFMFDTVLRPIADAVASDEAPLRAT